MARHLFGLSSADYAMQKVGTELELVPGAEGTVWDSFTGGTQITDLTDLNDTPITTVTADVNARVGFYGPDGVSSLYVDFGFDGGRTLLQATDLGTSLDQLQIYVDSLISGGGEAPATRYVASSDAPDAEKLNAHYVCDGVDDDVQIQAAIEAVKTLGGGTVLLSTGRFYTSDQIIVQGSDDVDDELDLMIRGQGVGNTLIELVDDTAESALHLTGVIRAHLSEFKIAVSGTSHGISSATLGGPNSGMRSFWLSSFRNLQIDGPWDGTHTGWAMHLGSPFRSIFENIDIGGVGNGMRMFSEDSSFNPGDCNVTRVFVDSIGDNKIAYQIDSTTNDGVMNQIEFSMCEAIASGTGCTGIHITGTGGWGTSHTHWRGINLEEFDKLIDVEYGSSNTFRLNHVNLRSGATGLTAYTFGANSFNNAVLSTGLMYATDSCVLFDDSNTMEPAAPNRVLDTRVYTVDSGVAVTATSNSSGTTAWDGIIASGDGTVSVTGASGGTYNVRSYGATGDGTTDDTAALQAALDAADDAGGGIVYLPPGTYKISSALTLHSNLTVRGAGVAVTTIAQSSTTAHGLTGSNLELVTLEDFTVDGPGSGSGRGINLVGTVIIYSFYINMTRVMVKQFGSHGIYIDDPVTSVLTNVTSKENGGEGFYVLCSDLGTVGTSTSFVGCYAHNNTASNGFRLYNMVYSTFTGCAADHNTNGYKIEACEGVTLTGCGAEENTGDSIQIQGGNNISVFGAWLSESGTNGVHVTGSAHQVTLKGIKEFSSGGATSFIDVDAGCTEVTIENCKSDTLSNSLAAGTTQVIPGNGFTPADVDLVSWTYDGVDHGAGSGTLTNGVIFLAAVQVREVATVSQIWYAVTTAGTSLTSSSNWLGLYNSSGTRLAQVDITASLASTGIKTETIASTKLTPGMYWVAILVNSGGTQPQISVGNGSGVASVQAGMPNGNLPAARLRYAVNGTSQTTLPATITPASNSSTGCKPYWAAIS